MTAEGEGPDATPPPVVPPGNPSRASGPPFPPRSDSPPREGGRLNPPVQPGRTGFHPVPKRKPSGFVSGHRSERSRSPRCSREETRKVHGMHGIGPSHPTDGREPREEDQGSGGNVEGRLLPRRNRATTGERNSKAVGTVGTHAHAYPDPASGDSPGGNLRKRRTEPGTIDDRTSVPLARKPSSDTVRTAKNPTARIRRVVASAPFPPIFPVGGPGRRNDPNHPPPAAGNPGACGFHPPEKESPWNGTDAPLRAFTYRVHRHRTNTCPGTKAQDALRGPPPTSARRFQMTRSRFCRQQRKNARYPRGPSKALDPSRFLRATTLQNGGSSRFKPPAGSKRPGTVPPKPNTLHRDARRSGPPVNTTAFAQGTTF